MYMMITPNLVVNIEESIQNIKKDILLSMMQVSIIDQEISFYMLIN